MTTMDTGDLTILRRGEPENRHMFGPFFVGLVVCYLLWGIQVRFIVVRV